MIDIECWRCGKKLGRQHAEASGVEIPCPRCHANNIINPIAVKMALDSRPPLLHIMSATTA